MYSLIWSGLLLVTDAGRYDWLMHTNEASNTDCFLTGYRYFCYSPEADVPSVRSANSECVDGTLWSFSALKMLHIGSQDLIDWLIPFHLIEQYVDYTTSKDRSSMDGALMICNCTGEHIGVDCEYELTSRLIESSKLVHNQRGRETISDETLTSFIDGPNCPVVEWRQICDGIVDCDDASDEHDCHLLEWHRCEEGEFQCRNGMCIPNEFLFDIAFDCMDSSDEQEIAEVYRQVSDCSVETSYECDERLCRRDQFSCGNGLCVPWSSLISHENGCANFRHLSYRCDTVDWFVPNAKKFVGICQQTAAELKALTDGSSCVSSLSHLLNADRSEQPQKVRETAMKNILLRCPELIRYPERTALSPVLHTFYNKSWMASFYVNGKNFAIQMPRKPHLYCLTGSMVCHGVRMTLANDHCLARAEFDRLALFPFNPISHLFCQMAANQTSFHAYVSLNSSSDYTCRDTRQRLPLRRINDGYVDCLYGDDERNNIHTSIGPFRYRCLTVSSPDQYVSYQQLGNGVDNCLDGSDEIARAVRWSSFKCNLVHNYACWVFQANGIDEDRISTVQLAYHQYCNTIWDTMNGQDESNCSSWMCKNGAYQCRRTGQCIDRGYLCDGEFDCYDGEDELNCPRRLRRWVLEDKCNTTTEHFCITNGYLEEPTVRRPCVPYAKAGDGSMDCIGGSDERNVFACPDRLMLGLRFLCDNQTKCLNYTVVCNGIDDCQDRTDELICAWNRSRCAPGQFACADGRRCTSGRCEAKDTCSDKSNWFWCPNSTAMYRAIKHRHVSSYEVSCYESSSTQRIDNTSEVLPVVVETRAFVQSILYGFCNRGFYLIRNRTQPVCFCPPSYYGARCQYESRRVTVRVRLDRRHRSDIPPVLTVLVSLIYNTSEILDHQFFVDVHSDSAVKYNLHLLYPRPRPRGAYAVRFEAYHSVHLLSVWEYEISPFDFLPVFRLAKILQFPARALPWLCSNQLCQNNGTCHTVSNGHHLCSCTRQWQGRFCERPLSNVKCAGHSVVRARDICVCPYGYVEPHCFVRNTRCNQSYTCAPNKACYPSSDLPPNHYWCVCNGSVCSERNVQITIYRKQTSSLPFLIQLLKISSDYPSIRQQILVPPLTNFPSVTSLKLTDSRNKNEPIPEIALLFTFERREQSVDMILHLPYINCSKTIHNVSIDLSVQQHRCRSIEETKLRSVKDLRVFCRNATRDGCFLLKHYICYCNSSAIQKSECISYHQRQTSCGHCYHQGYCVQGDLRNKSDFTCVCPKCVSGALCQFSPSAFSISLEYLYEKTGWGTYHFIAPSLFAAFGMILNGLCLLTFVRPKARKSGTGVYLLINSITSQLVFIALFARVLYLHMIGRAILSSRISAILCKSLPYTMLSLYYISLWLMAFVTVERAMAVILPAQYSCVRQTENRCSSQHSHVYSCFRLEPFSLAPVQTGQSSRQSLSLVHQRGEPERKASHAIHVTGASDWSILHQPHGCLFHYTWYHPIESRTSPTLGSQHAETADSPTFRPSSWAYHLFPEPVADDGLRLSERLWLRVQVLVRSSHPGYLLYFFHAANQSTVPLRSAITTLQRPTLLKETTVGKLIASMIS